DLIDVGTLLAVDLDVDEQLVHHPRRRLVLKALMRHDVAPVAGGIADRQQDRLILLLGLGERFGPPWPPIHRIMLMLQKIGAGLAAKAVLVRRCAREITRHALLMLVGAVGSSMCFIANGCEIVPARRALAPAMNGIVKISCGLRH